MVCRILRFRVQAVLRLTGMFALLALSTLLSITALPPRAWAATITAASCATATVQSAINSASPGDTIVIAASASPCTITGALTIAQGITLDGGGNTSMTAGITVTPTTTASFRITGFLFDANNSLIEIGSQGSLVPTNASPFRIDHNQWGTSSLNGPSGVDIEIWGGAGLTGLIDNNTIYAGTAGNGALSSYGPESIHNFGGVNHCAPGNCGDTWQSQTGWHYSLTPGSGNAIYVEHNTFTDTVSSVNGCSFIEAYAGSVTVVRYNTINNCVFDEHGSPGFVGARWWELYDNTFLETSGFAYSDIRAGSGLVFDNHMAAGSPAGRPFQIREEDTSETYPACYQIGRGFDPTPMSSSINPGWESCTKDAPSFFGTSVNPEEFSPAYFWGNDAGMQSAIHITSGSITLGRDIMCWDGTQFSGTCGNATDPPSPVQIHRCQDGTEAGCSATTTSTATYPYTPFTYPYPLDANGLPDPTAGATRPAPPTGLAATVEDL